MKNLIKRIAFLAGPMLSACGPILARDPVRPRFDPTIREYCHVLHFPSGWQTARLIRDRLGKLDVLPRFGLGDDYEFRMSGLLTTIFLVRGVERIVDRYYTTNLYQVDLADREGVAKPVTEGEWDRAAVVPLTRQAKGATIPNNDPKFVEVNGVKFPCSGDHWENILISPDRSLLVMESWTGKLGQGGSDIPGNFPLGFDRNHGKFFFDVYNAESGKKLFTITADFSTVFPREVFPKTAWLTERYFLIPLDERRNRCLVCDFGRKR